MFTNSLKKDKSYFKDFNHKFEGIVEAESIDEMTLESQMEVDPNASKKEGSSKKSSLKADDDGTEILESEDFSSKNSDSDAGSDGGADSQSSQGGETGKKRNRNYDDGESGSDNDS